MSATRAGGWVAGAIVLIVAIVAATWFFGAQPRLDSASETLDQAATTRAQNVSLRQEVAQLKKDFANLDEYRAELSALRAQVPTTAQLSDYARALQALADAAGVTLTDLAPGAPQTISPPGADQAPAAPTTADGADPAADPATAGTSGAQDPAAAATAALAQQIDGLVAVPVTVTVVGAYANVSTFLQSVQTGADRLLLAVSLNGTRQQQSEASGGRPATADGDLELAIDGWLYVLPQGADYQEFEQAQGDETATPDTPGTPELPGSDRNPFAPLPGT